MEIIDELKQRRKPIVTQKIRIYCIAKWFHRAFLKSPIFIGILVTIVIIMINLINSKPKIQDFPKIIYYMRHFQAKHNVDPKYLQVLDPDLTEYGIQQGLNMTFDNELELIICSPLSRTIQTYLSLFHDIKKRQLIPFMLDADLQEVGEVLADTARSKTQLKQKFPQLTSIIDRDLAEDFNDKNNPLYNASTGQSSSAGSTVIPRAFHTLILLNFGKVLTTGGET
ncbi:hypothetical protein I4U23_022987 [Adineta vaga]|nr:hypothetical protein I4U23_022987 [Adineta vaga]